MTSETTPVIAKGKVRSSANLPAEEFTQFRLEDFQGARLDVYKEETRKLMHQDGADVIVRSFYPTESSLETTQPTIIFAHGGGWVGGGLALYDRPARRLAITSGYRVDLVAYRLSPKNPYPAPLLDILLAYEEIKRSRTGKIHFFGDSAGANVILGTTLMLRDSSRQTPDSVTLFYPPVDLRLKTTSYSLQSENALLSVSRMNECWTSYAGGKTYDDMHYACFRDANFGSLPRIGLFIAEQDILRDECLWLSNKMKNDGADLYSSLLKEIPHSAIHFCGINASAKALYVQASEFINGKLSSNPVGL